LHENDRNVAYQERTVNWEKRHEWEKDVLYALAYLDKVCELVDSKTVETIRPFVEHQNDIVESETLLGHVQEPHAHGARPHHQPHELYRTPSQIKRGKNRSDANTYQIDLNEKAPVRQAIGTGVARFAQHKI